MVNEWMTVAQAADYLQLNPMTILRWIKVDKLPASRIGKSYRIALDELEKVLNEGKI